MLTRINIATFLLMSIVLLYPATSFSQSYYQSGGTATKSNQTYTATSADQSGVLVTNAGVLSLSSSKVTTSGNTTSNDSSSFYGLNAGVLAESASTVTLRNCTVNTTGIGANGVFSTGSGTSVVLSGDTIICTNDGAHGVDATMGAAMTLTNVFISTAGAHGAAISTDRGGGTVTVSGGFATASGQDSPGIYCTGTIIVSDATVSGTGAEAAVIEGANSITLTNTTLSGAKGTRDRGLMIYQSMSGDAQGTEGVFTMRGGTFTWPSTSGPAFYVTNSTGVITLDSVRVVNNSDTLIKAAADQWGTSGSNGGTVIFTAIGDTLSGAIVCDDISSATLTLHTTSKLTGSINSSNTAKSVTLSLDASSIWSVTADSYLEGLADSAGISGTSVTNIYGNGHNVYYDKDLAANAYLGGLTYSLAGGGHLAPTGTSGIGETSAAVPSSWALNQNYPNPFNPSTTFSFTVPQASFVTLKVYNVLGSEVATLVEGVVPAGYHTIIWKAGGLPSGAYFAKITGAAVSGTSKQAFQRTIKLLLMK